MNIEERLTNIETMLAELLGKKRSPGAEDLITLEEAAELCGLTTRTMHNYKNTGKLNIPVVKAGKLVKFKRADVIAWHADRTLIIAR